MGVIGRASAFFVMGRGAGGCYRTALSAHEQGRTLSELCPVGPYVAPYGIRILPYPEPIGPARVDHDGMPVLLSLDIIGGRGDRGASAGVLSEP